MPANTTTDADDANAASDPGSPLAWGTTDFRPGRDVGLVSRETVGLIERDNPSTRERLWGLVAEEAPLDDILDELSSTGLKALPDFGLAQVEGASVRIVARGRMKITAELSSGSTHEIDPSDVRTWIEELVDDVAAVTMTLSPLDGDEAPADGEAFAVLAGSVPASSLTRRYDAPDDHADIAESGGWSASGTGSSEVPSESAPAADPARSGAADEPDDAVASVAEVEAELVEAEMVDAEVAEAGSVESQMVETESDDSEVGEAKSADGAATMAASSVLAPRPDDRDRDRPSSSGGSDLPPVSDGSAPSTGSGGASGPDSDTDSDPGSGSGSGADSDPGADPDIPPFVASTPDEPIDALPASPQPPPPVPVASAGSPAPAAAGDGDAAGGPASSIFDDDFDEHAAGSAVGALPTDPDAVSDEPRARGVLLFSNGERVAVDRSILIGRNPKVSGERDGALPHIMKFDGPGQGLSRTHAEVRIDGDDVVVEDLQSTNGTEVQLPGQPRRRLRAGEPVTIVVGTLIDFGDELNCTLEPIR